MRSRNAIILTVFNRPELMLLNTMIGLRKNDLKDTDILIVDDGSTIDYADLRDTMTEMQLPFRWERCSTLEARPDAYNIDGHNNPAWVNNRAVEMTDSENLFFLSSDTIIPPNTMNSALIWDLDKTVYSARVIDMDSGVEWCGMSRTFLACWFIGVSRALFDRVGGFDEKFLEGMAFEDTDFTGRAVIDTRKAVIDCGTLALHQSHERVAYSDGMDGYLRSQEYARAKWGGQAPWDSKDEPLNIVATVAGDKCIIKPRPREFVVNKLKAA